MDGYARVAALVAKAGLDGVEISAAHGYLAAQFFTPGLNRRDDKWSEPARFLLAVLEVVRAAAPGLAVGVRLSADSEAAAAVLGDVAPSVDYVSVALGASYTYPGSARIVPPPPLPENAIAAVTAPFRAGPPLVATSRIVDPVEADRLLADGSYDAAGMTRALITDPDLPRKAREGRLDDVLRCIGCKSLASRTTTPVRRSPVRRTAHRPRARDRRAARSVTRRRIVVVGGGPAGLAAAAEAGTAGHEVVLVERGGRTGRADCADGSSTDARRARAFVGARLPALLETATSRRGSRPRRISRPSPSWHRMQSSSPPARARTSRFSARRDRGRPGV